MDKHPIGRLCLGTAQIGMDYGIANKSGRIARDEAFEMLRFARLSGIGFLDTASSYGDSEEVIGEFARERAVSFKVVSKVPELKALVNVRMEDAFYLSLKMLGQDKLYGLLLHNFSDYEREDWMWKAVERFKRGGLVEKIGFSLYRVKDLLHLLESGVRFDIIQLPYSVFDRRFEGYFSWLKEDGVEIYARSVFLQGLAFMEGAMLPPYLAPARASVERLRGLASKEGVSTGAVCLNFALNNPHIDKVIIGVDGIDQLRRNIKDIDLLGKLRGALDMLDGVKIDDEEVVSPNMWGA